MLVRAAWTCCLLPALGTAQEGHSIAVTRHNLSVTGPGEFRSTTESRICVFCHTPHRATETTPLWNRTDNTTIYLTYESPTFRGAISQPNGTTKLCLSCHDGTVALGRVVSLRSEIPMAGGRRRLTSGPGFLGTNLQDDHPVSFHYESSRSGAETEYRPASGIVDPVGLDADGQVQCTSCHDPHDNSHGSFLHQTDHLSQLCLSCHLPKDWGTSIHANSPATWNGRGLDPWPTARYESVRENGCANCHREHGAGRAEHLLNFGALDENCLRCHSGNVAVQDIRREVAKTSAHAVSVFAAEGGSRERGRTARRHASCSACHHPHRARDQAGDLAELPGSLHGVAGISSSGTQVAEVRHGYEVCYKCHGDDHGNVTFVPRVIQQANVRLEFDQGNPSFHPIEASGRNLDVPSLLPPLTTASRVTCWDCHNSDSSAEFGGSGPNGPHGSIFRPLLGARFNTLDGTPESPAQYALCYKCHNRSSILGDVSFRYHRRHVETERTPCSVCHDPHGISSSQGTPMNNTHLINFDASVVGPSKQRPGVPEFVDLGSRRGTCTLTCHGVDHVESKY